MASQESQRRHRRSHLARLLLTVALMFGFGFALVPLYDVLCDITGLNGRSSSGFASNGELSGAVDTSRTVRVQVITTVNAGAPWRFEPAGERLELHPGEFITATVIAENRSASDKTVQAVPSVLPWNAARYLHKTYCFCFDRQDFLAGQRREMPVVFTVDPELPPEVDTITLSYTLFELTDTAAAVR